MITNTEDRVLCKKWDNHFLLPESCTLYPQKSADGCMLNADSNFVQEGFGNVIATSGSADNSYHLTTKELDSDVGLYYFSARWYDPQVGRFISEDPVESDNLYVFVNNNPIRFTDPFGLELKSVNVDEAMDVCACKIGVNCCDWVHCIMGKMCNPGYGKPKDPHLSTLNPGNIVCWEKEQGFCQKCVGNPDTVGISGGHIGMVNGSSKVISCRNPDPKKGAGREKYQHPIWNGAPDNPDVRVKKPDKEGQPPVNIVTHDPATYIYPILPKSKEKI